MTISLGIDIGGGSVKVAAIDAAAGSDHIGRSGGYVRPDGVRLREAIREAVADARVDASSVRAVGVCVPGVLEHDPLRGGVTTTSVNLPDLAGVDLRQLIAAATGAPPASITFLSDANAGAYDIYRSRRLSGRLFALSLGTGAGAAVVDEGGLLFVDGESPGHLGQLDVSLDEQDPPIGPDGGAGGLEAYIGSAALAVRYGCDAAEAVAKIQPVDAPVRALARAIRIAHAIYRPHHVCLLGGIGNRLTRLLPAIRGRVENHLTSLARPGWTLFAGDSDYHAALGAAKFSAAIRTNEPGAGA